MKCFFKLFYLCMVISTVFDIQKIRFLYAANDHTKCDLFLRYLQYALMPKMKNAFNFSRNKDVKPAIVLFCFTNMPFWQSYTVRFQQQI
jgi:hypothetical protein